MTNSLYIC